LATGFELIADHELDYITVFDIIRIMLKKGINSMLVLGAILLAAAFLRWESLSLSFSWGEAELLLGENLLQPPFLGLVVKSALLVDAGEMWLRWWGSFLPGLLAVAGVYALGSKLVDKKTGLMAALLLATSSFHIYYSTRLLPYSLAAAAACWSWFFLLESVRVGRDSYSLARSHWLSRLCSFFPLSKDFIFFLTVSILGLYTSYFYGFVLVSQLVFLCWQRRYREAGWLGLVGGVVCVPLLPVAAGQYAAVAQINETLPVWRQVVNISLWQAPVLTLGKFIFGVVDLEVNAFYTLVTMVFVGLLGACVIAALKGFAHKKNRKNISRLQAIVVMLVLPAFLALAIHGLWPIVTPGRLLLILPLYYLCLSFFITHARQTNPMLARGLLILVLLANMWGVVQYYNVGMDGEKWRELNTLLHHEYAPESTVLLFAYPSVYAPWRWYEQADRTPFPTLYTGTWNSADVRDWDGLLAPLLSNNYTQVVVMDYLRSLSDEHNLIGANLTKRGWQVAKTIDLPGFSHVKIYQRPESISGELEQ